MMFRQLAVLALAVGMAVPLAAQDPTTTLPDHYRIELDNDYVRVVRVHYPAGVKLPAHTHPAGTTAYLYLNDAQGIVFRHVGSMSHVVNRPPVKSGGIRISYGGEELHEAENTSSSPADSLRIFFKTDSGGSRGGRKLSPADEHYENPQMRISRLHLLPEQSATIDAKVPALVVEVPSGRQTWVDAGGSERLTAATGAVDFVRIDFLTRPRPTDRD